MHPSMSDTPAVIRYSRGGLAALAAGLALCCIASTSLIAQVPAPVNGRSFDHTIILGADWLQANALPLNRTGVAPSIGGDISWRPGDWAVTAGFLRIARDTSTVQGGTLSFGRVIHAGPIRFIPAVSGFGGEAYVSSDSTGYNYVSNGTTGHVARYSYSDGIVYGGGAGLTIELPLYRIIGLRAVGSWWYFGGDPVAVDRTRTVVGAGLTLRVR
jgi:hypothetical protein